MTKFLRLSLLLSALVAVPALAQSGARADSRIVVGTADLDLASKAGQRTLDRRLARAVIEVCGAKSSIHLAGSNAIRRCRNETSATMAVNRYRLVQMARMGAASTLASR